MKNLTDFRKTVACERQTFLLAHRRWGTFPPRETFLSGDERGETSAVRRLVKRWKPVWIRACIIPLSPTIHLQILKTDLHTLPWGISLSNRKRLPCLHSLI